MLVGGVFSPWFALAGVAVVMMAGGILSTRRVAETMALKVTKLNPGQGFTANLITSFLVIVASKMRVPVSTTHVSCGSLFGIGTVTGEGHWKTIAGIVASWVLTLPIAGIAGALSYLLLGVFK